MTIILVQNSRREVKMLVHNLCFRVSCGSFLTTFLSFMTKRANFAFKMRTQVVKPRNRLEDLLFVFMASYLLCCGDVELNPGPSGNETDTQTSQDPQEEAPKTKRYETRVDLQTVSTEIPPYEQHQQTLNKTWEHGYLKRSNNRMKISSRYKQV